MAPPCPIDHACDYLVAARRYRTASPAKGGVNDRSLADAVTEPIAETTLVVGLNHSTWYVPGDRRTVNGFA